MSNKQNNSISYTWKRLTAPNSPHPRSSHTASILNDTIYIFGGSYEQHKLQTLYKYHITLQQWTLLNTTGTIPTASSGHSTCIHDNQLILYGGHNGTTVLDTCYILNLKYLIWKKIETPVDQIGRTHHSAVMVGDRMYVFGGFLQLIDDPTNEFLVFHVKQLTWEPIKTVKKPIPRGYHAAVAVDDTIYVHGGFSEPWTSLGDMWCFSVKTNKWTEITSQTWGTVPSARYGHSIVLKGKSTLLCFGGSTNGFSSFSNSVYEFDVKRLEWKLIDAKGEKPNSRRFHRSVASKDRMFMFFGYTGVYLSDYYELSFPVDPFCINFLDFYDVRFLFEKS